MDEIPAQPQSQQTTISTPNKTDGLAHKNIVASVITIALGVILIPSSVIFSVVMNVGDDNPVFSDFYPMFYIPFILALITWLISKNKILSSLFFIVSLLIVVYLANGSLQDSNKLW